MFGKYLNASEPAKDGSSPVWSTGSVAGNGDRISRYSLNQHGQVAQFGDAPRDYLTDVVSARAVNFIKQSAGVFFLIEVATIAPHIPYTAAPRDAAAFPDRRTALASPQCAGHCQHAAMAENVLAAIGHRSPSRLLAHKRPDDIAALVSLAYRGGARAVHRNRLVFRRVICGATAHHHRMRNDTGPPAAQRPSCRGTVRNGSCRDAIRVARAMRLGLQGKPARQAWLGQERCRPLCPSRNGLWRPIAKFMSSRCCVGWQAPSGLPWRVSR